MAKNITTDFTITEEQFLQNQGPYFNVRLLRYYYLSTNKEEQDVQKDNDVLFFEFPEGRYSIRFIDLKRRADSETLVLQSKGKTPTSLTLPNLRKAKLT